MNEADAIKILSAIGCENLYKHWQHLSPKQKQKLSSQLRHIDLSTLKIQQQLIGEPQIAHRAISVFPHHSKAGNLKDKQSGQTLIAKGLAGCLIVAGGQGSRLHIDGPKGICEVTKVRKKSLFQLLAEKTLAAGKLAKRHLPLAIMTSPLNHEETVAFFHKNHFFGLDPRQISFFQQKMLPLLDANGNLFLETADHLSEGPDGNGGALQQLMQSGLWNDWYAQGVRYVNFILVDNALADPFDAELLGYQERKGCDVVIKCIERSDPNENVGLIVQQDGNAAVVEYTELSQEERSARNADKSLRYPLANLSLFCLSMEFAKKAASLKPILHKSFKAAKYLDKEGQTVTSDKPMAWKFEKFIFDILPYADKVEALVYPREACFAPLKNFSGNDSFDTVRDAIERRDRHILSSITGLPCDVSPLEISQEFYYPTPELLTKWKGQNYNTPGYPGYIEG